VNEQESINEKGFEKEEQPETGSDNSSENEEKIEQLETDDDSEQRLKINGNEDKLGEMTVVKSPMSEASSTKAVVAEEPEEKQSDNHSDSQSEPQPPSPLKKEPAVDKYEAMQPRLKKFLKIYQQSSKQSLGGPVVNDIENLQQPDKAASNHAEESSESKAAIELSSSPGSTPSRANSDDEFKS
jgi:hypothetical protein